MISSDPPANLWQPWHCQHACHENTKKHRRIQNISKHLGNCEDLRLDFNHKTNKKHEHRGKYPVTFLRSSLQQRDHITMCNKQVQHFQVTTCHELLFGFGVFHTSIWLLNLIKLSNFWTFNLAMDKCKFACLKYCSSIQRPKTSLETLKTALPGLDSTTPGSTRIFIDGRKRPSSGTFVYIHF